MARQHMPWIALLICWGCQPVLAKMQVAMEMREAEMVRLGEEAARRGGNVDAMALQHRCSAQEGLILQLTEQVTSL